MQKHKIANLIPQAMKLIETQLSENGAVGKVYNSYIASMGAAMVQSGVLPTLAIFSAQSSGRTEGDRRKLMRILTDLLISELPQRYGSLPAETGNQGQDQRLLQFAIDHQTHPQTLRLLRRDLTDASIAVKLALRTFKLVSS